MADKENIPPGGTIPEDGPASGFDPPAPPSGGGPEQVVTVPEPIGATEAVATMSELEFDHMLNGELKLRAGQIGIPGELDTALGMLEMRIMDLSGHPMPIPATIRARLASFPRSAAPRSAGWLARFVWALIDIDEPGLFELDIDVAAIIWPNAAGHTISYLLGQEEIAGNPTAKAICDVLATFQRAANLPIPK